MSFDGCAKLIKIRRLSKIGNDFGLDSGGNMNAKVFLGTGMQNIPNGPRRGCSSASVIAIASKYVRLGCGLYTEFIFEIDKCLLALVKFSHLRQLDKFQVAVNFVEASTR